MNLISAFDIVSFLAILTAFCLLLTGWKRALNRDAKLLFVGFLILLLFYSVGNVLEWTGISNVLGLYEEYAAILVPVLLVFFFYTFLQKKSEEALKESAEKYHRMEANIPGMVYMYAVHPDGSHSFPYTNSASRELFDIEPGALMHDGNLLTGLIHPDDRERRDKSIEISAETLQPWRQELRHIVNGQVRWYDCMSRPEPQPNGDVIWDGIMLEITERKIAERALLESEERYKSLFEGAPDAVYLNDLEGNIIDANKTAEEMTGYSREELIGKNLAESGLLLPKQVSKAAARLKKNALGESVEPDEFTLKRKDGSYVTVEVRTFPIRIGDQTLSLGIARDISGRKKAEEALRISEEKFRSFTEASPAGVFATDVEGNPIFWNERLCDITGMSFSEAKGQGWAKCIHPEDRDWVFTKWYKSVKMKTNFQVEHRFEHRDDTVTWGFVQALPVKNPQGHVTGYIGTITDITKRKQAEQVRLVHLRFLESLDQVNRSIQGASDLDQMMNDVLEAVLSIFHCDRSWLFYPCDPDAPSWRVPMECTVPEYPGALAMGIEVPMDQGVAEVLRTVLESDGPVKFGPESEHPLPFNVARQFKYQSQISMAIHPKVGKSWMFGLHQCSHSRVWTEEEEKLLQEIGRRIADAMSSMLTLHNLRESQERYRALVDNTDLGIALISRDFEVLMSNPAQGRMLQKDHGDFIGGKCHFEFEKRDELCPHCPGRLAMESGHTHEAEAEGVRVDGTKISVRVQASPVYGEYGSVVGFVEIVEDITERKRAEQALSISELQYRTTIDSMGDAIHVVDANLRLVLFNDRFKQWTEELNIQVDNPIGRELLDVFSFLPDKVRDEYNQVFNGGKVLTTEEVVKIANREIITETRKIPIYEAGQVVRVVTVIRDITESKKAKEALQESEERFRGIYENALVGLYRTTPDGRILMANPAIVQMLGYSSFKELAKRSVEKVGFSSEYPRSVFKQRIETDGQVIGLESGWMKRDGTTLFVRESAKAIRDKEGKTLHYEGTVEDITERKRAEEALRESEEKFRSLAEQSPNVIFINQKGKIVYANKKCEEVTGYKRQELYSPDFNFLNLIAPESQDLIKKNFARHLKGREIPPYEYTLINKAGERIEAINTSRLIQYEGMPTIIGIVTDITERKRAERALREREETLMSIFRAAPIGIGLVSNRVLLQVNNKICEMLGYSSDELIGKNARILYLSDEDYEYVGREKYRQIRKYGTGTVETRWKCKDGRIIDIILSSTVFDSCDFSKGVTFTALDITDRKQAEQRLLEHRTQLKSLASELSLAEERERRRVAIELHDRIGQSLVISKMKLQTLRESLSTSEYADALKEVYNCLGQVIQDTRTLTFDLSYPILYEFGFKEAVSEWLEEQIRRKHGIETEFEDDGQPKLLDEDISVLLFRDVRELLINVVKHAEANKVKVSISRVDNDIQVCVEDNGVGFNADEIALLPTEAGGFGLFSIRERLEQIGGLIEIESKPGRGSRITMTAPIKYENIIDGAQK